MALGLLFWILFVLWFAFSLWAYYPFGDRKATGFFVLLSILVFILGWRVFGFIIQN